MNPYTSTYSVKVLHGKMNDAQMKAMMLRMAKAAKGRSNRSVLINCGDLNVYLWGKEDK